MEPLDRAKVVLFLEDRFRDTLHKAVQTWTEDPEEQTAIAAAVLAKSLRAMYLDRGEQGPVWLESVLRMVLQPADAGDVPTVSSASTSSAASPSSPTSPRSVKSSPSPARKRRRNS